MAQKPTFKEALRFWIKLGFISFGGPAGQVAIMHEFLVEKKKWISDSKFLHALNYCMVLPGPEAQQLATYIGWMLHGTLGGLVAGIFFVLPSMFILLGLSTVYVSFGNMPLVYAMFAGLKPAVIAIVLLALIKIGKKSLLSPFHYVVAAAAFICIFFFNIPFPLIIVAAILIATVARNFFPSLFETGNNKSAAKETDESAYYINKHTRVEGIGFNPLRFWKQITTGVLLWGSSLALLYFFTSDFAFWKQLALFFTKAALVTFGGAYAVLPYVAQVSVEKFHWLSNLQMIDGLALGETTPGPLIMILVFVGFMAGYNRFDHSIAMGSLGLVATTVYTFLPCFLFIFIGAPLIERTQENKTIKQVLSIVTAAVVGVVLNLSIYLGKAVLFPKEFSLAGLDLISLTWVLLSFVAMYRFKIGMITWIIVSAVFGVLRYLIETGLQ
ncbi:chromate efflux transporter [Lacibacter luteus]|uniref:Chromate efflux transporter n=1 Tax=Lacibacter luteus TaxID=2508719 RepID=A0A4Q1CJQ6_9BACT|nr:chromate efflux transporter [Lacibacter luteus]RXK60562.1 chromate efflux transporter [Lacibacter luteus]